MKRVHIPNIGPNAENIPVAVAVAIREAKAIGSDTITLITPVKDNLDSIVLGDFLGRDIAKRLMKGGSVALGDYGVNLTHESTATMQKKRRARIGLAFYVPGRDSATRSTRIRLPNLRPMAGQRRCGMGAEVECRNSRRVNGGCRGRSARWRRYGPQESHRMCKPFNTTEASVRQGAR